MTYWPRRAAIVRRCRRALSCPRADDLMGLSAVPGRRLLSERSGCRASSCPGASRPVASEWKFMYPLIYKCFPTTQIIAHDSPAAAATSARGSIVNNVPRLNETRSSARPLVAACFASLASLCFALPRVASLCFALLCALTDSTQDNCTLRDRCPADRRACSHYSATGRGPGRPG